MGIKELIQEQLNEYQSEFDELSNECIEAMKANQPYSDWEEKAKKAQL